MSFQSGAWVPSCPLALLVISPTGFPSSAWWGLIFSKLQSPAQGSDPRLWPGLCGSDWRPPACGLGCWGWAGRSSVYRISTPACLRAPFSLYPYLCKICSTTLQFVFRSFSIFSCNFDISVGEDELRIFLLCHLHPLARKMCTLRLMDGMFCVYLFSPFFSKVEFNSSVFLMIFSLNNLSIDNSGVLKSPIIILLSISLKIC